MIRRVLGKLLGPLLKSGLPLMKNVLQPLVNPKKAGGINLTPRCGFFKNVFSRERERERERERAKL